MFTLEYIFLFVIGLTEATTHIKILLNTDYREIQEEIPYREMIYTGPADEFFDYRFGKLPYRSLEFKHETKEVETYQDAPVVNYPNTHAYTRVTEFKYLTGQKGAELNSQIHLHWHQQLSGALIASA